MGEQIFGDLTNAVRNVAVSRKRALQLIGGLIAVAVPARVPQAVEARKRRKPPLAFVAVVVTIIVKSSPTFFEVRTNGAVAHPASNTTFDFGANLGIPTNLTTDKMRTEIVAQLKTITAGMLQNQGQIVAKDRIAVTLL